MLAIRGPAGAPWAPAGWGRWALKLPAQAAGARLAPVGAEPAGTAGLPLGGAAALAPHAALTEPANDRTADPQWENGGAAGDPSCLPLPVTRTLPPLRY